MRTVSVKRPSGKEVSLDLPDREAALEAVEFSPYVGTPRYLYRFPDGSEELWEKVQTCDSGACDYVCCAQPYEEMGPFLATYRMDATPDIYDREGYVTCPLLVEDAQVPNHPRRCSAWRTSAHLPVFCLIHPAPADMEAFVESQGCVIRFRRVEDDDGP
jgi:hypothetical protein